MNAHPIHMQVNSPELMRQHEEHKARRARLSGPDPKARAKGHRTQPGAPQADISAPPVGDWADAIVEAVCEYYNLKPAEVIGIGRTWRVVRPRQVAMYLADMLTENSLATIGVALGGRDATTVHHGARQIEHMIQVDHQLAEDVQALRVKLLGGP